MYRGDRCNQPNDFMDAIIMGNLIQGLADHEPKKDRKHSSCESGNTKSISKPNKNKGKLELAGPTEKGERKPQKTAIPLDETTHYGQGSNEVNELA